MSLVDDAFAALSDIRAALDNEERPGCHVFMAIPHGRRGYEWRKLAMGSVADQLAALAGNALADLESRAADDEVLAEFDFDAMAKGSIGIMSLHDVPAIAEWFDAVPDDDHLARFDGDEETAKNVRFYVIRLNFADGRRLTQVRGGFRKWAITLKKKGAVAAIFSREHGEMTAIDGPVINFDGRIDFFMWDGLVFILNFATFESITDIRDVTIRKAEEAIDAVAARFGLGENVDALKVEIGKRIRPAKRLAAAYHHGLIADIDPQRLVSRALEKKLRMRCDTVNDQVRITIDHNDPGQVQDLVNLLSDLFLKSPVTGREYEAPVRRPPKA